jgi:hypothetical protein
MSDLSLEYTPERATELKENIDAVLGEIEQASEGSKVGTSLTLLTDRLDLFQSRRSSLRLI